MASASAKGHEHGQDNHRSVTCCPWFRRRPKVGKLLAGLPFPYTFCSRRRMGVTCNEAVFRDARSERAADHRGQRTKPRRLAEPPGAGDLDLRRRRQRRHSRPYRRRPSIDRLQAAVLRRGARRRRRPDRHQGHCRFARPLHHRHRQHLASRAAPDEQGRSRLRSEEGSGQHRDGRGLAGVAVDQPEERLQESQRLCRARQKGVAELFVIRPRQHGPSCCTEFH